MKVDVAKSDTAALFELMERVKQLTKKKREINMDEKCFSEGGPAKKLWAHSVICDFLWYFIMRHLFRQIAVR